MCTLTSDFQSLTNSIIVLELYFRLGHKRLAADDPGGWGRAQSLFRQCGHHV